MTSFPRISYSKELANEPERLKKRTNGFGPYCLLSLFPTSAVWDTGLGYLSIASYTGCSIVLFGGMLMLVPSIIVSKYIMKWPSFANNKVQTTPDEPKNISTTSVGSLTALKTLSARSQMYKQRCGGPDNLAPKLMDQLTLLGPNIPGSWLFTQVYLAAARFHFYLTGRIFADQMTSIASSRGGGIPFGETSFLQVRTCWLDDCMETFLQKQQQQAHDKNKKSNIVILGAGYDTRCYRLASSSGYNTDGVSWYEVDAPGTQAAKLLAMRRAGIATAGVNFVSCDFENQDWMELLTTKANMDPALPTFFVWEGVTPYLERDVVISTIKKVATCGKGSCIGFDYVHEALVQLGIVRRAAKATGEPWKFGLDNPHELVDECNEEDGVLLETISKREKLEIFDHLECNELVQRYCAKHCDGRPIGFLKDFGGLLLIGSVP